MAFTVNERCILTAEVIGYTPVNQGYRISGLLVCSFEWKICEPCVNRQHRRWGMHCIRPVTSATYHVVAAYADGVLSFNLSEGETFADLAARLDQLGERHLGVPTAIYVKTARRERQKAAVRGGD